MLLFAVVIKSFKRNIQRTSLFYFLGKETDMSEALVKQLIDQQIGCILDLIKETRALIGSLESIESIIEDGVVRFTPLLLLIKKAFRELLKAGQVDDERTAILRDDIDLLEEEVSEFESHSGVYWTRRSPA